MEKIDATLLTVKQLHTQSMNPRYATIVPNGIILPQTSTPHNPLMVTLITWHAARTRYNNRHPVCRSLDGVHAINQKTKCFSCQERHSCTPQIVVNAVYRIVPVRFLLSYTSANNFLTLVRKCCATNGMLEGRTLTISVIDRGRWGEATFSV